MLDVIILHCCRSEVGGTTGSLLTEKESDMDMKLSRGNAEKIRLDV